MFKTFLLISQEIYSKETLYIFNVFLSKNTQIFVQCQVCLYAHDVGLGLKVSKFNCTYYRFFNTNINISLYGSENL